MSHLTYVSSLVLFSILALFCNHVEALGLTDTITWGGDNSRTGYQTNHNMDPAIVGGASFGQIFRTLLPGAYSKEAEQIYSQPLVYTASDGIQYVYLATTQNNLYKLDAKTGVIVASRNLHIPFNVTDLYPCADINPLIGVTGTGVIDPATGTWYMIAKTYVDQTKIGVAQGRPAGRQILHAVSVEDLSERPNFPVDLEGTSASNNPSRIFNGGIHHQRPALLHYGNYIYAGLGSHCVMYNFTGWIMGWDKTTGQNVARFATQGLGVTNEVEGAGVWMSGGGLASDDAGSMFFATGNGYASQLDLVPVNGRNPPSALEQSAVHMTIADDGSVKVVDFFIPWEKKALDGDDKDLGTSPLEILPKEFACGDVKRIGVITGKTGKTYWLNLDDMGGYRNGPNRLDAVLQTYEHGASVYAGAGVYPLEGGYIYINVVTRATAVFKFSCDAGVPFFTKVAEAPTKNAGRIGVGHGTTTSLNGQPGTGLVWTSDVENGNLRIYKAVPENGLLVQLQRFNINYVTKFNRPVFGDGRAYMGTTNGYFYGFGSPINLPLTCTNDNTFDALELGATSAAKTITCVAQTALTITSIAYPIAKNNFVITNVPLTPLQLNKGASFTFQAAFKPAEVGILSADVLITTSGTVGFSADTPVTLRGTGQSAAALLQTSPVQLSFGGAVTGENPNGIEQSVLLSNLGNQPLTISRIGYNFESSEGPFTQSAAAGPNIKIGPFTLINLPTVVPAQSTATLRVNFDTSTTGDYVAWIQFISNGGNKVFQIIGSSGDPPVTLLEFQTETGWVTYDPTKKFSFGTVYQGNTKSLRMRITNVAEKSSAPLLLTVSKPPFGSQGIINANNQVDLAEGTSLAAGESASATLYCSVPKSQWNVDPIPGYAEWILNINDGAGKRVIEFECNGAAEQSAPFQSNGNGQGRYRYIGCYVENNPGRQLSNQYYGSATNTISMCTETCGTRGAIFCGTQYHRECWGGNTIPVERADDINCNYDCSGALLQTCGGNGEGWGAGRSYISLFADIERYNSNGTIPSPGTSTTTSTPVPTGGPIVNPGVGGYTSIGCYTEATTGRALPNGFAMPAGNKHVATCVAGCAAKNYLYAGLEYGQECWCGNTFGVGAVPAPASDCKIVCADKPGEFCGGSSRLNVYRAGTPASSGTTQSSVQTSSQTTSSSTLQTSSSTTSFVTSSTTVRTSSATTSLSSSQSSNTLSSSTLVSSTSSQTTTVPTTTSITPSTTISPSSSITSASSSTTRASTSSIVTGPVAAPTVGTYAYQGCYLESAGQGLGRALSLASFPSDLQTAQLCASNCAAYLYFGLQYGRECWCGDILNPAAAQVAESECSMPCAADKSQLCGDGNRLNVYRKDVVTSTTTVTPTSSTLTSSSVLTSSSSSSIRTTLSSSTTLQISSRSSSISSTFSSSISSTTTIAVISSFTTTVRSSTSSTTTSTTTTPGGVPIYTGPPVVSQGNVNFTYYSCVSEPSPGRLFTSQIENSVSMTIDRCLSACWNYQYAGVEYGRECWCGNTINFAASSSTGTPGENVSDTECDFSCPGNSSQFCGGNTRMSLYWFDKEKASAGQIDLTGFMS